MRPRAAIHALRETSFDCPAMTARSTQMPGALALTVGFEGTELSDELKRHLERGVRSFILFGRNVESPEQVAALTSQIKNFAGEAVLLSVDQEGGVVRRLRRGFSCIPAMRDIGEIGDARLARELGRLLGRELSAVGLDLNFAPVLDVDTNPDNPVIGQRAFSSDAARVAELAVSLARGMEEMGVASCGKHFPGHGDTQLDSHVELPRVMHDEGRLDAIELLPFRAYAASKLAALMTAHVVFDALDPGVPATLSSNILRGLLRERLGFSGIVFTDDVNMRAVADRFGQSAATVSALQAGADSVLVCRHEAVVVEVLSQLANAASGDVSFRSTLERASVRMRAFIAEWAHPPIDTPMLCELGAGLPASAPLAMTSRASFESLVSRLASATAVDPTEQRNG